MLRVLSSPRRLCSGLTRRDFLQAGGVGALGLGLPGFLNLKQAQAESSSSTLPSFGRAKQCLFLYLYGGPSQLETFDMKPNAPAEIRGTMKPIPSSLPGIDVCEYLPHTAKIMDRISVVRSVTHPYPIHGVAFATTGVPAIDVAMELAPQDTRHQPFFGSIIEYLERQKNAGRVPAQPHHIALPFPFSTQRTGEVHRAGPYAAYLGGAYNPVWTEFIGESTRSVIKELAGKKVDVHDPYLGCSPESHFRLSSATPPAEVTVDRLNRRRSLLEQFDVARRHLDVTAAGQSMSSFQDMAFSLISSTRVADALDVRREPTSTRELYGHTLFGQGCLAGRRLLEAGTKLVSVFWDEYGLAGDAWDTHWNHFPRMVDQLLPQFDRAFSGLIEDLDQRGMLDDTLVVCLSEHGRTPALSTANGGGRDHWSRAYSVLFAGGGIKRGHVLGMTDATAGDVVERPVSPKDVLATAYHLLGIDPHTLLPDHTGRPISLVPHENDVVHEILA